MKRIGKGKEWEITDKDGITWYYKAVTRMEPFRVGKPTWSEYDEGPYLCWDHQRYYLEEFVRPDSGSIGMSLFDGFASISYGSGVGIRLGANNEEGQLIYFYIG